jgi:hypothetical protein
MKTPNMPRRRESGFDLKSHMAIFDLTTQLTILRNSVLYGHGLDRPEARNALLEQIDAIAAGKVSGTRDALIDLLSDELEPIDHALVLVIRVLEGDAQITTGAADDDGLALAVHAALTDVRERLKKLSETANDLLGNPTVSLTMAPGGGAE